MPRIEKFNAKANRIRTARSCTNAKRMQSRIFRRQNPNGIVNTVGVGDALFSCFIHCYATGMSAEIALQYAELFAAIKIGTDGAAEGFVDDATLKVAFDAAHRKV